MTQAGFFKQRRQYFANAAAIVLALAATPAAFAQSTPNTAAPDHLEEVVVTALRREQTLQTTPASITALTGENLQRAGAQDYRDFITSVPGVSYSQNGGFKDKIFIRGLSDSMSSRVLSTTGIYIDETPITEVDSSLADIGTFDITRVEVLRGPQGTLYGSGSMGGTVRIITNKPDLGRYEAAVDTTLSSTKHGGTNYQGNAMVNLPIVKDKVALRVVAGYRHDDGYTTNVATGEDNANDLTKKRIRTQLKIAATDQLEILLSYQYDRSEANFGPFSDLNLGGYKFSRIYGEYSNYTSHIWNAAATYDFGFASLLSTTSYIDKKNVYARDFTSYDLSDIQAATPGLSSTAGVGLIYKFPNRLFTQEFRLASQGNASLSWLVGAYYSNFTPHTSQDEVTNSSVTNGLDIYSARDDMGRAEAAAFGEATYNVTSKLALTAGVRAFEFKIKDFATNSGLLSTGSYTGGTTSSKTRSTESSQVFKFRAAYQTTPDNLLFAQASQGYRAGGGVGTFNATCTADLVALGYATPPTQYTSDKLWDYELGTKNAFLDRRLTVNATAYYIPWKNVQLAQNLPCGSQFISNAGSAKSRGAELELVARPIAGLDLRASGAYNKSTFDETNTQLRTLKGGDLPNSPRWTFSGSAQYTHEVAAGFDGYARGDVQYVDSRLNDLVGRTSNLVRQPAYTIVNVRLGVSHDNWDAALFVTNLTDERAILNTTYSSYTYQTISTPKTIGLNVAAKF